MAEETWQRRLKSDAVKRSQRISVGVFMNFLLNCPGAARRRNVGDHNFILPRVKTLPKDRRAGVDAKFVRTSGLLFLGAIF